MKVCLSSRQSANYLKNADEIKVQYRDRAVIPDLAELYPNATIILRQGFMEPIDFEECERFKILTRNKLIICLNEMEYAQSCKEHELPFYWGYRIQNYSQLNALKAEGVCYVLLDTPLFFEMDMVKQHGVPVRAIPNVAHSDGFKRDHGVYGTWIRPEDIDLYEDYIEAIEFERCDEGQEQALFRIYTKAKEWVTELGVLVEDFNHLGNNRLLTDEITRARLNCGARCEKTYKCDICMRMLKLADLNRAHEYEDAS